jgi:hypothetical protein
MLTRLACCTCLAIALGACGDDGGPAAAPDADPGLPSFVVTNTDASGDVHSFTITCTDLASELPVTFVSDGPHSHSIRLEVAQLQAIHAGQTVEVEFTEGHGHSFSITKPDEACKTG